MRGRQGLAHGYYLFYEKSGPGAGTTIILIDPVVRQSGIARLGLFAYR